MEAMPLTRSKQRLIGAILVLALQALGANAQETPEETSDHIGPNQPPVIRKIDIVAADLFDPGDDFIFAEMINALHIRTRHNTIQQELLFKPNERGERSVKVLQR